MSYTRRVDLDAPFDDALESVRSALGDVGFGILTEIDIAATLKDKLGAAVEPYVILGACNPPLAQRALAIDPSIGALMPCNVVVRSDGPGTVVEAFDPDAIDTLAPGSGLDEIVAEVSQLIDRALAALA